MGTEIATLDQQTGSLTLAPNSREVALLYSVRDEHELTDEQFSIVERIARSPVPALPTATDDDVRAVIGSLSTVKKRRNASLQEGRLQLGLYRKVLAGIPAAALKHAGEVFLRQSGWMPEPAEVLEEANRFLAPELLAHRRARTLADRRRQRQFQETLAACRKEELSHDQLQALDDYTARVAQTQGSIIIRLSGERVYRNRETVEAHLADVQREGAPPPDERGNRASEAPDVPKRGGSVGDVAAGIMKGMEVDDGEA